MAGAYPGRRDLRGRYRPHDHSGEWRANIPVWDPQKCKQCLLCAPFCPDASIPVTDGRRGEFDFDHCKGCGICWKVCPFGAIDFVKEEK